MPPSEPEKLLVRSRKRKLDHTSSRDIVPIKDDPEAVSAHMNSLSSAPGATPETHGNQEISLRKPISSCDHKEKHHQCLAMYTLSQDQSNQCDSHYPGDSIKRPALTPARSNESKQQELIPSCSVCTYPCWNCGATDGPPRSPSPISERSSVSMDFSASLPGCNSQRGKKRKISGGKAYVGPKDELFASEILRRCGLKNPIYPTATMGSIFGGLQRPTESRVVIELDDQQLSAIATDVHIFETRRYDENTLAFLLVESLLKRDRFVDPFGPQTLLSLRRDRWKIDRAGPEIPGHEYYYDWIIEPDATYMVSVNMFEPRQRERMWASAADSFLLAEPHGVCPYLTVEYKSTAKGGKAEDAVNQVTVASIIWLNQRRNIKARSGSTDYGDLRHYAVIFPSNQAIILETTCSEDGYVRRELDRCFLVRPEELKRFIQWSNAIHSWGLGPNASAFREDVEKCLDRADGEKGL